MKCPYCLHEIHPVVRSTRLESYVNPELKEGQFAGDEYQIMADLLVCPGCKGGVVDFKRYNFNSYLYDIIRVSPKNSNFIPAPDEVPKAIAEDFNEANVVLPMSPKASAALARRCLQAVLAEQGYIKKNLVEQIEEVLKESDPDKSLPSSLKENIDAIRNFGNSSAHPITDKTTLQVVEVEEGEAEWCLEILSELFEYYFVGPARAATRRQALSAKLANAGKPPMK